MTETPSSPAPDPRPRRRARLHDPGGLRVLVVEDQPLIRELLCELVSSWGYAVEGVDSLAGARARAAGVAVVLLDLQLPDGEGMSLVPDLQGLSPPPAVIVSTGFGTVENAIQALHEGAFGFLLKPVRPSVLHTMLTRATSAFRQRRDLELHRDILHSVKDVVAAAGADGSISYANRGAAEAFRRPLEQLHGAALADLIEVPERDGSGEYRIQLPDGDEGVLEGSWTSLPGDGQGVRLRVLIGRDVTRERNARRDLMRSGALAELGMMLAEAAHEINNPAAFLLANLSTLQEDLAEGTFDATLAAEMVSECIIGVRRISGIVSRLRSLTRAQIEEHPEQVFLAQVVREAVYIARVRVGRRANVHLVIDQDVEVMATQGRLSQAIMNLVVNAADALEGQTSPAPLIEVSVGVDSSDPRRAARIDVTDNGPGVPEHMRDRLFEPFMTSKAHGGGTGLGLPISRSFVEDIGGTLRLESTSPAGSRFRVLLPHLVPVSAPSDEGGGLG
ncbi:MAG: response regulator [Deltaproteobacteria bacterium]|nr:response regulator [Deltaproteobacteria bacterium]